MGETVLFLGATGLVGGLALPRVLASGRAVDAPVRRALALEHANLNAIVAPLGDAQSVDALAKKLRGAPDAYVCCLGTTLRAAGSEAAFVAVDHDLVVRTAQLAHRLGARRAIVVSSVGADARSRNFYLRVKGTTEDDVAALGFARCDFLRPSLLLGERSGRRPAEQLFQSLSWLYNPLLHGPLARYRAIGAADVAVAVAALLELAEPGRFVHENDAIVRLAAIRAQGA